MTYKRFVEKMVEKEACKWMQELCGEGWYIWESKVDLNKNGEDFIYNVTITVHNPAGLIGTEKTYIVGGAVSELCGICNSVVWKPNNNLNTVVWAANEELRNLYGITKFEA